MWHHEKIYSLNFQRVAISWWNVVYAVFMSISLIKVIFVKEFVAETSVQIKYLILNSNLFWLTHEGNNHIFNSLTKL